MRSPPFCKSIGLTARVITYAGLPSCSFVFIYLLLIGFIVCQMVFGAFACLLNFSRLFVGRNNALQFLYSTNNNVANEWHLLTICELRWGNRPNQISNISVISSIWFGCQPYEANLNLISRWFCIILPRSLLKSQNSQRQHSLRHSFIL